MKSIQQDLAEDLHTVLAPRDLLLVLLPDDPTAVAYTSSVAAVSARKLVIKWPAHDGKALAVHRDQTLSFHFLHNDVPYEFTALVDDVNPGQTPQLAVIMNSEATRIQRRQNFRIQCMIPVEIILPHRDAEDATVVSTRIRTTTCDFSANGLAVRYFKPMEVRALVEVRLSLPDEGPLIHIPCQVVYSEKPAEGRVLCRTGLHYLTIKESDQARIVRYVYRTQLKGIRP